MAKKNTQGTVNAASTKEAKTMSKPKAIDYVAVALGIISDVASKRKEFEELVESIKKAHTNDEAMKALQVAQEYFSSVQELQTRRDEFKKQHPADYKKAYGQFLEWLNKSRQEEARKAELEKLKKQQAQYSKLVDSINDKIEKLSK